MNVLTQPFEISDLSLLEQAGITRIVCAIGVFDGIHVGHRQIISKLLSIAKEYESLPTVITFYPHPRHFLIQDSNLKLLLSQEAKIKLLGQLGVKAVVTINFTRELSEMQPEQFIDLLTANKNLIINAICVGKNWKFGSGAKGNVELLNSIAQKRGIKLYTVDQVFLDGMLVSSTTIRKELSSAKFKLAYNMLGCNYKMMGIIEKKHTSLKCMIKYGIVPHHPGSYSIELTSNSTIIPAKALIDKQNIKENSFLLTDNNVLESLFNNQVVEIFFLN